MRRKVEYGDEKSAAIAKVFRMYDERLNTANALDFDDLLIKTVKLLRVSPETREKYNERYKYILVDEYQDTNSLQFALDQLPDREAAEHLRCRRRRAEYLWLSAGGYSQHSRVRAAFPDAKVILLEQNYRSTQTILDAAHAIIENNVNQKKKKLWTANPGGERIFYYQAYDADGEARFVASKIEEHRRREPERADRRALSHKRAIACF